MGSTKPFRILSLDGGGVKAILQAKIVDRLMQYFPTLHEEIDMYAGTSAGSIVAGALASGISAEHVTELFKSEVGKIFKQGYLYRARTFDDALGAAYNATELEKMLSSMIGQKTLKDLKPKFLSPSFKLNPSVKEEATNPRWKPVYFHNFDHSDNSDTPLLDVILRTSAAPTYFPIKDGYVDGGTFANNPALCAVTTAMAAGIQRSNISVLSLSTGLNPRCIPTEKIGAGNWGLLEWGPWLIDLLLESTTQSIDYQCKCLLQDNYKRVDPVLPYDIDLDNAAAVPGLITLANGVDLTDVVAWIEKHWNLKRAPDAGELDSFVMLDVTPDSSSWKCVIQ